MSVSLMDNPFSNILAGSVGFFVKAGLLGGGAALLGVLGLVGRRDPMTSARERQEWVEGYEAPIKRALWERITSFGVPRLWATLWMVCCLYVGLLVMVGLGFTWLLVPAVVWMLGHGVLMGLTLFDAHWDEMVAGPTDAALQGVL